MSVYGFPRNETSAELLSCSGHSVFGTYLTKLWSGKSVEHVQTGKKLNINVYYRGDLAKQCWPNEPAKSYNVERRNTAQV